MTLPTDQDPPHVNPADDSPADDAAQISKGEHRNLTVLAVHQILLRVGWLFKAETVVMPAFLDSLVAAGWIRGILPLFNRLGQGLSQLVFAGFLSRLHKKTTALAVITLVMAFLYALLAFLFWGESPQNRSGAIWLFLGIYLLFFLITGLYQQTYGTVQGKLIRPNRRGKLLLISSFWGSIPAIGFSLWLMPRWIDQTPIDFGGMFAFVASFFLLSAVSLWFCWEPSRPNTTDDKKTPPGLSELWKIFLRDRNLRRLFYVVFLTNASMTLFPHYQAFARDRLGLGGLHMVFWIVVQNMSIGFLSLLLGSLADRKGYRVCLQLVIVGSTFAPALAMTLASVGPALGARCFWLVFVGLGFIPLGYRIMSNYTLEIGPTHLHPQYLSIASLAASLPFLMSPLVGWLIDLSGYDSVFLMSIVVLIVAVGLSLRLEEPRKRLPVDQTPPIPLETEE